MGALADSRKRLLSDPFLSPDFPASKKPKLQYRPFIPDPPVRRSFHGPQRILRAFGFASGEKRRAVLPKLPKMGNFVSCLFRSRKEDEEKKGKNDVFDFEDSGCGKVGLGLGLPDLSPGRLVKVVSRKVEPARRVVESSLTAVKEPFWVKKDPAYKELHNLANRRDLKLNILELEQKLAEKKLSEIRAAQKVLEEREKEEEELRELFCPLTAEEEKNVSCALRGGSSDQLLVTHEASNIEITRKVIRCLDCGGWLNDEVINLYLVLLKEREIREPKRFLKCHFFNTFFYKKLISGKNGYDFNAVRRWTTKRKLGYSLVECDKIFVPIHRDIHWCLAVINVKDETLQYLDSLGGMDTRVLRVLARYFMDEVKDKSDKHIDMSTWKQETVDNLPRQANGFDCGMFMLKYTDFYSRGLGLRFSQEHMGYYRKRTTLEILRLRAE